MAKQLYCVSFESETYIVAESQDEAEQVFEESSGDILWDMNSDDWFVTSRPAFCVAEGWETSLPYNDDEEHTCQWWLDHMKQAQADEESAAKARAEFDAHPKFLEV